MYTYMFVRFGTVKHSKISCLNIYFHISTHTVHTLHKNMYWTNQTLQECKICVLSGLSVCNRQERKKILFTAT